MAGTSELNLSDFLPALLAQQAGQASPSPSGIADPFALNPAASPAGNDLADYAHLLGGVGGTDGESQSQSPTSPAPGPGISSAFAAPVTNPSQVPEGGADNVPVTSSVPLSAKVGIGTKVSTQGYDPAAMQAIQKGPQSALDKQMLADRSQVQSEYNPLTQAYNKAGEEAQAAALNEANVESAKIKATSDAKLKIAEANKDFLAKEQAAVDTARAESAALMGQYKTALADYMASGVNPAQLWDAAGKGGQFAMLATAFTHDFLAARNIQSSGLDAIKTAIKYNIDSQLENMRKKGEVTQQFRQLWEMQRQQSATDAEARARMQGFYMAALSNQIEANLGQYDSQLALAKGQAVKAKLAEEQVKNDLLVQTHIDEAANQRATNRVHVYAANLTASSAKYTADAHIQAALIAANAKGMTSPLSGAIADTSTSGGNRYVRRLLPGIEDKEGKIRMEASNVFNTVGNIEKLVDLQDQIEKVPPGDIGLINRLQDERARVAEAVRNMVKMGIIYDFSGKQINEKEVEIYDALISKKDWFTNGDNIRQLGMVGKMLLDKENAKLSSISTEIQPGDPLYGATAGKNNMAAGESALTDIQSQPGSGRHQNSFTESQIKDLSSPDATESAYGAGSRASKAIGDAVGYRLPGNSEEQDHMTELYNRFLNSLPAGSETYKDNHPQPTNAFVAVERLVDAAFKGDASAKAELDRLAAKPRQSDTDALVKDYIEWDKQVGLLK